MCVSYGCTKDNGIMLNNLVVMVRHIGMKPIFIGMISILMGTMLWLLPVTYAQQTPRNLRVQIGVSGQGLPIEAFRFGTGSRKFVIVGATHGAPERNTGVLSRQLIDWFGNHPEAIPADVRVYIIPVLNPDGDKLESRQNANGVDLNRNMNTNLDKCSQNNWSQRVFGANAVLSDTGGAYADSEPESRVIRAFLLDASAVVFLHSAAGLVFPAFCEDPIANAIAQTYATAGNYQYARYWDKYPITGGMHDWARGIDLPAIIPELESGDEPEFDRNLAGIRAVLANTPALLPALVDRQIGGIIMPLPIWRFWQAYGADMLGAPLSDAQLRDGKYVQAFATIMLSYDPRDDVQPVRAVAVDVVPIGGEVVSIRDVTSVLTFSQTDTVVHDAFARYYQRVDGAQLLGAPQDNERMLPLPVGMQQSQQQFDYGVIRYDELINQIVRLPVVWQSIVATNVVAPTQPFQVR